MDLIGHGKSTKISQIDTLSPQEKETLCATFYTLPGMVAEIIQILAAKGVKKAHFVGWSLGGHIAYGIGVEQPELVASIVSIGSPPVKLSAQGLRQGFTDWFATVLVPQWVEHPAPTSEQEAVMIRDSIGFDATDIFAVRDLMETDPLVRRHLFLKGVQYDDPVYHRSVIDGAHFVDSTEIPLCLLAGDQDAGINHALIASYSDKLKSPESRVCTLANAKHAVFKTSPAEYYAILDTFLDTVSSAKKYRMKPKP